MSVRATSSKASEHLLELGLHPRHRAVSPNLNGFVERLQGTIVHTPYRTAFWLGHDTSLDDLDADVQRFIGRGNYERPAAGPRAGRRGAHELGPPLFRLCPDGAERQGCRHEERGYGSDEGVRRLRHAYGRCARI